MIFVPVDGSTEEARPGLFALVVESEIKPIAGITGLSAPPKAAIVAEVQELITQVRERPRSGYTFRLDLAEPIPATSYYKLKVLSERRAKLLKRPHVAARWPRQQRSNSVEGDLSLLGQRRFSITLVCGRSGQIGDAHRTPECLVLSSWRHHSGTHADDGRADEVIQPNVRGPPAAIAPGGQLRAPFDTPHDPASEAMFVITSSHLRSGWAVRDCSSSARRLIGTTLSPASSRHFLRAAVIKA
jgi:hypothetical protein